MDLGDDLTKGLRVSTALRLEAVLRSRFAGNGPTGQQLSLPGARDCGEPERGAQHRLVGASQSSVAV
jgi:hypothetical protein